MVRMARRRIRIRTRRNVRSVSRTRNATTRRRTARSVTVNATEIRRAVLSVTRTRNGSLVSRAAAAIRSPKARAVRTRVAAVRIETLATRRRSIEATGANVSEIVTGTGIGIETGIGIGIVRENVIGKRVDGNAIVTESVNVIGIEAIEVNEIVIDRKSVV